MHISYRRSGSQRMLHFIVRSANVNVEPSRSSHVFRHFCGISAFAGKSKLKLTVTGRVVRLIKNQVCLSSACYKKYHFVIR